MQKVWRILAIDGGGIRGIIPAHILASIEERTGKPISQLFDLIAGTSTGGILALGLTKPNSLGNPQFTARDLCDLYDEKIPHIFRNPQSWWGNLLAPKYRSFAFQEVLKSAFGDCRLKSALTDVLIPCFDIDHRLPYLFRSRTAKVKAECDFPMRDVALAASASPTLFYPVHIPRPTGGGSLCLVDGGVFANNPAVSALAESKSLTSSPTDKYFMVSVGTGHSTRPLTDAFISFWGYVQWSRPMLDVVMDSISESVHEQMTHLLSATDEQHYYRLQVRLSAKIDSTIDNASKKNMQDLSRAVREFCSDSKSGKELGKVCDRLVSLSNQNSGLHCVDSTKSANMSMRSDRRYGGVGDIVQ